MLSKTAGHYLVPPPSYFWSWDLAEGAVSLTSGRTFAFGRELFPLLEKLAEESGLPPLGSILLVLYAARSPGQLADLEGEVVNFARSLGKDSNQVPHTVSRVLEPARGVLRFISELPADLRDTQSGRLEILRTVFADTFNCLPTDRSLEIVEEFRLAFPDFGDAEHDISGLTRLLRDLKALLSASQLSKTELENRVRTGLDRIDPDEAEVELETAVQGGELWSSLEQSSDPELQAIAHVATQIAAAVRLPRPLMRQDEQPSGGVDDIAPRGDPSRLLLSELAWDDLTFSVRLAHGEALYLLRESPPAAPCPRRIILLDNGILLWGRPRVYTTAVALTLQRNVPAGVDTSILGHLDGHWKPLEIDSIPGILRWWGQLSTSAHGGEALPWFLDSLDELGPADQPEVIWVTHTDAAYDAAPTLAARNWPRGARFFQATVDGDGEFSLILHTSSGVHPLSHAQLVPPPALRGLTSGAS